MAKFSALIASSEGAHPVLVDADTEAEAKEKLELDFGKGNVRAVKPYLTTTAVDPDKLGRRDDDILEFSKGRRRRGNSDAPERKQGRGGENQTMALVLLSLVVPALGILIFGAPLLKWFQEFWALLPK